MDCSETKVFLKELKRMCDSYGKDSCENCSIRLFKGPSCSLKIMANIDEAIKIVQKWSDAHPIKTRLSVLKEHYPNVRMTPNGVPFSCVRQLYNIECPYEGKPINDEICLQCWNTPIEGEVD